ncbi:hypothetical protein [Paludisphaera rhizosphaerae]|uniref:hypothetical protein n=1 Tax=Paludisphaera rhizosphaerae TaxID=2711216 RepID=UPI0013EE1D0E|nr:hypothetical protein [Paludisphaera rhizosphaerae]
MKIKLLKPAIIGRFHHDADAVVDVEEYQADYLENEGAATVLDRTNLTPVQNPTIQVPEASTEAVEPVAETEPVTETEPTRGGARRIGR